MTNSAEAPGAAGSQVERLMRLASYAALAVAAILITVKFAAWILTDSVAVLSSLIDSGLDAAASLVNLIAIRHSLQPADREHRFGHGKAEALAGLGQAAFVGGSALFLVLEALPRLRAPQPVQEGAIGIAVMLFSIVLTLALVLFQRHVIRRSNSLAVGADSLHYQSDLLVNVAVIGAIGLAQFADLPIADPILALAIAGYVLWSAWQILRGAYDTLMDRELPDDQRRRIREIVMAHPEVRDMHDLRTRRSGTDAFIQFHIELPAGISLQGAHEVSDTIERDLHDAFPEAEVLIHQDPEGVTETRQTFG